MAAKRIPDDVRRKVAEAYAEGLSKKKIAEKHGISPTSVTRILKEKASKPPETAPAPEPVRTTEMEKKLTDVERRIKELEEKILYFGARKQGKGTRA